MENQQPQELMSNNQGVWWGWWVLIIIIVLCLVCGSVSNSSNRNRRKPVPIHTTEAATMPESFQQFPDDPTEFPDYPSEFPDYPTEAPLRRRKHRKRRRRRKRRRTSKGGEPGCPPEIPGVYPDALDPIFRRCQAQKIASCYAKCDSVDPLYFFFNP